ncbi:hypothetical protein Amet_0877 [Alkaliphilus metalliredigens QYMF]|uniref:Uncharacterized protein n=1 Tax=Alkaliphilus metalliredigens (strain QYMF) TaxID=293826 RepID=A6TLN1_ALKMQ|nr:hypothetical protein [Alkaliphilus metalliredigens]ABR47099.1 hypothetical protein Amet_0877 [Alkaliphilus metalliredigens QYMF]
MSAFSYVSNYLEFNIPTDNFKAISKLNKVKFKNRDCYFIEAVNKVNPTDYTIELFEKLRSILEPNKCLYVDLSDIYGLKNSSWIMKWEFIMNGNQLEDERFYHVKDLKNIDQEEYIIVKEYINSKIENI